MKVYRIQADNWTFINDKCGLINPVTTVYIILWIVLFNRAIKTLQTVFYATHALV